MAEITDNSLHFHEYFKVIRNRLWVIFTIFVLTVISGAYVTEEILPKVYTATTQIQVRSSGETSIPGFAGGTPDRGFDATSFQAEFEIMQSADVLSPIVTDLGLDKTWAKRVYKSNLDKLPMSEALGYMNRILKIDFKRGTNIIEISVQSEVPKEAADIANALADRYKTMRDFDQDQKDSRGLGALTDQIEQQKKIVEQKKDIVEQMRKTAGDKAVYFAQGASSTRDEQDLDRRKADLLSAKEDYDSRHVLLDNVSKLSDDDFVNTLQALGAREEPNIANLRSDTLHTESDIDDLRQQGFGDTHPRILALKAQIARMHEQMTALIAATRRAMDVDLQMAKSRVDLLQKEVSDLEEKTRQNETDEVVPFRDAEQDLQQQKDILTSYILRLNQVKADRNLLESPVKIIQRADPPDYPSKPNKSLNMSISIVAGLFAGIVVAFLIEYLDTSVKTMADAELLLGLPVLTVIPNKGGPMPLSDQAARLPHAEGYRILRAKLDLKVQNGIGPSLTMLSGGPGEGKSTTIYNLAIVCAQAGQSVILVDCDLRRPTLHDLMKLPNDRGLANYLRGEGEATEYIQQSALPKLHLLSSGDIPLSEIGVLAGDKIRHMLDDLKQRYDLVLIDSPPVLGISDGSIIAREVDYVILVIQHRRYPREISLRAKRAIEEVHGNCVGMVLNCVAVKSDDSYYYYSSYGNYYKKADRKVKKSKDKSNAKKNGKELVGYTHKSTVDSDEF